MMARGAGSSAPITWLEPPGVAFPPSWALLVAPRTPLLVHDAPRLPLRGRAVATCAQRRRCSLLGHRSQNVYRNRTPSEPLPESAVSPWMASILMRRGGSAWQRFALTYHQLLAMPRRWRRQLRRKAAVGLGSAALVLALSLIHI